MSRIHKLSIAFVLLLSVFFVGARNASATVAQADLPTPTPPPCTPIDQAMAQGLIRLTLTANGNLFYKNPIHYKVENLTDKQLTICFPVGMLLVPDNGSVQSLIIALTVIIDLTPNEVREDDLAAFCINETKAAPEQGAGYRLGGMASGGLLRLAYAIEAQSAQEKLGAQYAVWAITDHYSLDDLNATPVPGQPSLIDEIKPLMCLSQDDVNLGQELLQQANAGVVLYQGENPLTSYCQSQGIPSLSNILQRLKVIGIGAAIAIGAGALTCIAVVVLLIVLVVRMLRKKK
jgi:hypothetical protein